MIDIFVLSSGLNQIAPENFVFRFYIDMMTMMTTTTMKTIMILNNDDDVDVLIAIIFDHEGDHRDNTPLPSELVDCVEYIDQWTIACFNLCNRDGHLKYH